MQPCWGPPCSPHDAALLHHDHSQMSASSSYSPYDAYTVPQPGASAQQLFPPHAAFPGPQVQPSTAVPFQQYQQPTPAYYTPSMVRAEQQGPAPGGQVPPNGTDQANCSYTEDGRGVESTLDHLLHQKHKITHPIDHLKHKVQRHTNKPMRIVHKAEKLVGLRK